MKYFLSLIIYFNLSQASANTLSADICEEYKGLVAQLTSVLDQYDEKTLNKFNISIEDKNTLVSTVQGIGCTQDPAVNGMNRDLYTYYVSKVTVINPIIWPKYLGAKVKMTLHEMAILSRLENDGEYHASNKLYRLLLTHPFLASEYEVYAKESCRFIYWGLPYIYSMKGRDRGFLAISSSTKNIALEDRFKSIINDELGLLLSKSAVANSRSFLEDLHDSYFVKDDNTFISQAFNGNIDTISGFSNMELKGARYLVRILPVVDFNEIKPNKYAQKYAAQLDAIAKLYAQESIVMRASPYNSNDSFKNIKFRVVLIKANSFFNFTDENNSRDMRSNIMNSKSLYISEPVNFKFSAGWSGPSLSGPSQIVEDELRNVLSIMKSDCTKNHLKSSQL